ncbi:glycosyltransferase [Nocardia niigatensis]
MTLSVIVPARNEEAALGETLRALLDAAAAVGPEHDIDILVVDSASTDGTAALARSLGVRVVESALPGAARARNLGARHAHGELLVFVDADTHVPADALARVLAHHRNGADGGLTRLAGLDGGLRARLWWLFWDHVRLLPLARAKAMSAFMFCTREAFDAFGPFDEQVQISEEWPVLSGLWRARRTRFVHDRELTVRSSSRRMQLQRFGYTRTFAKYVWAVLHPSGRAHYTDTVRAPVGEFRLGPRPSAISLALARAVSAAPMHTLRLRTIDRATWVEKRRRPGLLILLPLWNCWLTLFGEPVRVLSGPAWHERERAMHHARTGFDTVRSIPGSLLVPLLPGVPADDLLRTGSTDPALVITTAARALRTLHAAGESHGDAILRNVLVDPATRTAHWIDFETRHAAAVPPAHRRADDLWTLARSTAHCLGPGHLDTIATAMAAAGLDPATRRALLAEASDPAKSTTVLALARAPLTGAALDALRRTIVRRLSPVTPERQQPHDRWSA